MQHRKDAGRFPVAPASVQELIEAVVSLASKRIQRTPATK